MWGEAWAKLATTIFSWTTDEAGLAAFKKRRACAKLRAEIKEALNAKDYARASAKLAELRRLSDAV